MVKIKRGPLVFQNVLSTTFRHEPDQWFVPALEMKQGIIQSELYMTGPFMFKIEDFDEQTSEAAVTLYAPVHAAVQLEENETYRFEEQFELKDGLMLRHPEVDEPLTDTYGILLAAAEEFGYKVEPMFYHIYLEVFGEGMYDVFLPILEDASND